MGRKSETYIKLLNCTRWRALRVKKLTAQPLCERCLERDKYTFATEVHHIRPVDTALDDESKTQLAYDYDNLMSVCHTCHKEIHESLGRKNYASRATIKADSAKAVDKYEQEFFRKK